MGDHDVQSLLRRLADELDGQRKKPLGCAIVMLNSDGEWAGILAGLTPFAACAALEYAKTDLVVGGGNWQTLTNHAVSQEKA